MTPKKQKIPSPKKATEAEVQEAKRLDDEILKRGPEVWNAVKIARAKARDLGKYFRRIHEGDRYKYIPVPGGGGKRFQKFDDYINARIPQHVSRSTIYLLMGVAALAEGPRGLPAKDVDEMPEKNAGKLAKVKPEKRTRELVEKAKTMKPSEFAVEVQKIENEDLPPDQQKPIKIEFFRRWAPQVVERFEDTLEQVKFMKVVRDGDLTLTLEEKAVVAICAGFMQIYADEVERDKLDAAQQAAAEEEPEEQLVDEIPDVEELDLPDEAQVEEIEA